MALITAGTSLSFNRVLGQQAIVEPKRPPAIDPNLVGTYNSDYALDSPLVPVNQLLKFVKFGFGFEGPSMAGASAGSFRYICSYTSTTKRLRERADLPLDRSLGSC